MKEFLSYLNQRRCLIGLLSLFAGIFAVVFALYRLPMAAVAYGAALCLGLGIPALLRDYARVRRQHRQLSAIRSVTDVLTLPMPETENTLDRDYQQIIQLLCREQSQRQEAMDRKYRDMTEYYTAWAHQIKTPIASMKLNLQNEDSALSRQLSSDLMRIEQYVEMVLVFLQLDEGAADYVIRACDLDAIVRQAVRKFAGEFIARKLRLDYTPIQAQAVTDEKWLSFVVEQVLSNALKYTVSGGISIYLEAPKTLCVRDTGIGIAPEDLPRIFEKGYTGCNGRSHRQASGIGLYLCKRICGNLGHGISAESVPDQGTTIRIDLNQRRLEVE